jgi:hypothetical protein
MVLQGCGGDDNGVDQSLHDTVTMERDELQDKLDAANAKVKELEAQAGTDGELAAAKADAAKYKKMVDDAMEAEAAEKMRAYMDQRGMNVRAAMMEDSPSPTVVAAWDDDADAPMVTVMGQDDYGDGDAPPDIDGWTEVTLTRERDMPVGGTDSVYVYTDIAGPQAKKFMDVHGETVGFDTDDDGDAKLAMSDDFPAARLGSTYDHPADADPLEGTYDGVAGEFSCTGTCTITPTTMMEDGEDVVRLVFGADWMFTPDDDEQTVMVNDADFLTFGIWLYKPVDAEDGHLFAAFSTGKMTYEAPNAGVEGTATFRGSAAGKYVKRDTIAKTAEIGLFTAKSKLEANFDIADAGELDGDSITGTISGFVSGGAELAGWEVTLGQVSGNGNIDDDDTITAAENVTSGTIAGVTIAMPETIPADNNNNWRATFHGPAEDARTDMQPGSVVGTFDLHGGTETVVSVSGGFGAHNISPEN